MNPIEHVYVLCHGADLWMARICVASIRYWYPDIPITLLKNQTRLDTSPLESGFGVRARNVSPRWAGSAFAKLELLTRPERERYLYVDADVVFVGRVLDSLAEMGEDLVVATHLETPPDSPAMRRYYHIEALRELDPAFEPPGFCFSAGHYVATSGLLRPEDLDDFVDFSSSPPRHRTKGIFHGVDQGLCNYLFPRRAQEGVWSLGRVPFAWWARGEEAASLERRDIFEGPGVPRMIHWAGTQLPVLRRQPRADILASYEAMYVAATRRGWAHRTLPSSTSPPA